MKLFQRNGSLIAIAAALMVLGMMAPSFAVSENETPEKTYTGGETLGIFTFYGQDLKVYIGGRIRVDAEIRQNYFFDKTRNPNILSGDFPRGSAAFVEQETQVNVGFSYEDIIESRITWEVQSFWDANNKEAPITNAGLTDADTTNDALLALREAWAGVRPIGDEPIKLKIGLQDMKLTHSGFLFFTYQYGAVVEADYDSFYFNGMWAKLGESTQDRALPPRAELNGIHIDRLRTLNQDHDVFALAGGLRNSGNDFRGYVLFNNDHSQAGSAFKEYFVGLSVASVIGKFSLNGELAAQFGTLDFSGGQDSRDLSGFGGLLYAAYDLGQVKVHGTFVYGSGDDKANDGKYNAFNPLLQDLYGYFGRDGIWVDDSLPIAGVDQGGIYSRMGRDSVAGLGMMALNAGVEVTFARKHQVYADLSYFTALTTGGLSAPTGKVDPSKGLGVEGDLGVMFRAYRNLRVSVNYGIFLPGQFFKDYYGESTKESAHNFFVEGFWRF